MSNAIYNLAGTVQTLDLNVQISIFLGIGVFITLLPLIIVSKLEKKSAPAATTGTVIPPVESNGPKTDREETMDTVKEMLKVAKQSSE